jgi:hypothetical protein
MSLMLMIVSSCTSMIEVGDIDVWDKTIVPVERSRTHGPFRSQLLQDITTSGMGGGPGGLLGHGGFGGGPSMGDMMQQFGSLMGI